VEGHKRHHVPAGRACHGLIGGDDPLDGLGEGRQLARLNKTKELLAGDVGVRLVRHHDDEVSGEPETQVAATTWMRKNSELKRKARGRKEADGKQKSRTSTRHAVLKGTGLTLHLRHRARRVSKTFARTRVRPSETAARNRDTSIPAVCRLVEPTRGLGGAVMSVTSAEIPAPTTVPTSPLRPQLP
jgi:hypothetical protein